ncbi:MAG: UbiA family prenyltransferase [Candidatus Bathyarchaeota archaeon]|nr:UbiA family prenyltransferase [Candidatus Bathyarchaeota archaeon]
MKIVIMIYSWLSIIGLCIIYRGIPPIVLAIKVFFAMTGTALGMYLWNDVCDFDQDTSGNTSNKEIEDLSPSTRPLGRGLVSKRRMGVFSALLVALGLTASALINLEVLLIQFAFLVLFFIYSAEPIRLKKIFLMKQVTVTIGGAIACISAGLAAGTITIHLLYLTGLYVLFTIGVNPIGDLRDIDSDRASGVKTIAIVWGPGFTIRLALATFTAAAATTWIGFYGLGFNITLPIIGTIVCAAFAYVMYPLLSHLNDYEYMVKRIYTRGLPLFFILQLAVLLGSLPF